MDSIRTGVDRKVQLYMYDVDSLIYYGFASAEITKDQMSDVDALLYPLDRGYILIEGELYADYFPLKVGNTWTYSYHKSSNSTSTGTKTSVNGELYWRIVGAAFEDTLKT